MIYKSIIASLILLFLPITGWSATHTVNQDGSGADYSVAEFNALSGTGYAGDTFYFSGNIDDEIKPAISGTTGGGYVTLDGYQVGDCDPLNSTCSSSALIDRDDPDSGTYYGFNINDQDYLIIQDFRITDCSSGIKSVYPSTSDHITIRRNHISVCRNQGIYACGDYWTIGGANGDGNVIYNVGAGGTPSAPACLTGYYMDDLICSYNLFYNDDEEYGVGADGIVVMSSNRHLYEYNTIHDMGEDCIDWKGYSQYLILRFNHFYNTYEAPCKIQRGTDYAYVYGNRFHSSNDADSHYHVLMLYRGADEVKMWANLIFNGRGSGLAIYPDPADDPGDATVFDGIVFYNNTVVENVRNGDDNYDCGTYFNLSGDLTMKNNIFARNDWGDTSYRQIYTTSMSNITMDYDLFYYNSSHNPKIRVGSTYYTLTNPVSSTSFCTVYSEETHGAVGDPKFTDVENRDFTLLANSPCIDNGVDLSGTAGSFAVQGVTYTMYYDDVLDPANTDWATIPPTVATIDQDSVGSGWEIGAYAYGGPPANSAPYITDYSPGGDVTLYHDVTDSLTANCTAVDDESDTISYFWTFQNGTPATSTSEDPGSVSFACGAYPCSDSCSIKVTDEHGLYNTYNFTVTHAETAPTINNFILESDTIAWYLLDSDVLDSYSDNDLAASGGPSYSGGGIVLDGSSQFASIANLDQDISGITEYVEFEFDAELNSDDWDAMASEWNAGDENVWMSTIEDETGAGTSDVAWLGIGHTNGTDYAGLYHGSDLNHGTKYRTVKTYDPTSDDAFIYVFDSSGNAVGSTASDTSLLDANVQNIESTPFILGARNLSGSPGRHFKGTIYHYALLKRAASADEAAAMGSEQFPLAIIQDEIGISPDQTYGANDPLTVALVFKRNTAGSSYVPVDVTWTDGSLPYAYLTCETGGTDLQLYHSYPASGVAGSIHYFSTHATDGDYVNSMIAAGMTSADLAITSLTLNGGTFTYGSPAINCDVTLPGDLASNAAIVIDTTGQTFGALYHSNSSGTQINDAAEYSGKFYLTLQGSNGEFLQFADGPLSNIAPTIPLTYGGSLTGQVYSGLDATTDKIVFEFDAESIPGCRLSTTAVTGEAALPHGATIIVDDSEAENEMTSYNYPDGTTIAGGAITILNNYAISDPLTIGPGMDYATEDAAITDGFYYEDSDIIFFYGDSSDVDFDNKAVTVYGKNRITGSISNDGSVTYYNLANPMISP